MEKSKVRVPTLISGIFTILSGIGIIILSFILFVSMLEDLGVWLIASLFLAGILAFIIAVLVFALGAAYFVFGIAEIRLAVTSDKEYQSRFVAYVFYLVFDALAVIGFILAGFLMFEKDGLLSLGLVAAAVPFICFVLKIIDRIIFSSRVKKGKVIIEEPKPKTTLVVGNLQTLNSKNNAPKTSVSALDEELTKLKDMKEKGIISAEEFDSLRQKAIDKSMK